MRLYHSIPLTLALLITAHDVSAVPSSSSRTGKKRTADPIHVPLKRRAPVQRNAEEWGQWMKSQKDFLEAKYAPVGSAKRKRAEGMNS